MATSTQRAATSRGNDAGSDGLSTHSADSVSHLARYETTLGLPANAGPKRISDSGSARRGVLPNSGT